MEIYTLNVGQGQFAIVTGANQAVIVDTYVPLNPTKDVINVKSAMAHILKGKELVGLVVTGFDADHFNEVGIRIVLNKYRPNWIMYPKYFKETQTANACFAAIKRFEAQQLLTRHSMALSRNQYRLYKNLSTAFSFEIFSPHEADMNSSNNCSLVCKVTEVATGHTYLITGDTENDRWDSIVRYFGGSISAKVLAAPHHGSKNGMSAAAMEVIRPRTVLISAGVGNQYGHPDREATALFGKYAQHCYSTSDGGGQSIRTVLSGADVKSYLFTV